MLTQANPNNVKRIRVLRDALYNTDALRRFMREDRSPDLLRNEEELLFMLNLELAGRPGEATYPRRSIIKRLHAAMTTVRRRREWEEIERRFL